MTATDGTALVRDLLRHIANEVTALLDGLDPALLDARLAGGTNSIGWLLWHLTRSHDRNVSELRGRPQLWLVGGWHARFDRAPDPADTGYRHSAAEAADFRSPGPEVLAAYHRAAVAMIDDYLDSGDDPFRTVHSPTLGDEATVHARLAGVLADGLQHVGQAALLKGMMQRRR
ncbi:DinB family protein [Micromonospora sp. NPDC049799]|uniref:DinB family protein n=1 Tax=Micromonospora sp. NPDC049799 TaxID=3154741 RepID=UPI0033F65D9A